MSLHLYALILQIQAEEDVSLPAMVGEQTHAAFLGMVRAYSPELSEWLHSEQGQAKPFTVALLAPHAVLQAGEWQLRAGQMVRLRITLAGQPLYQALMDYFVRGNYRLQIGRGWFRTGRVITSGASEELAGATTLADLWQAAQPQPTQTLHFVMPTTWKIGEQGGRKLFAPFPDPEGLFKALSLTWKNWSTNPAPYDYKQLLTQLQAGAVTVQSYSLRTVHWQNTKEPHFGFIGRVRYEIADAPDLRRVLDALVSLGFYGGVGSSRGRGLGVIQGK